MKRAVNIMSGAWLMFAALYGGFYFWNVVAFPLGEQTPFAWWVGPVGLTIIILAVVCGVCGVFLVCLGIDEDAFKPQPKKEEPLCKP